MINWIKNRLKERTTLDGVALVSTGLAMLIVPVDLIAYAAIAYGLWTIWKSE
ncbi:hypothetical protein N9R43_01505 [bacterium]|nr:hypothetical protein [bacterium]